MCSLNSRYETLLRLYSRKCGQLEKSPVDTNAFRHQVLKAEAEAIREALRACLLPRSGTDPFLPA